MLKVVIVGYGEMFTNLIAGTLDANCKIVGVLRKDMIKYPSYTRKLKDILNVQFVEINMMNNKFIDKIISDKPEKEFNVKLPESKLDAYITGNDELRKLSYKTLFHKCFIENIDISFPYLDMTLKDVGIPLFDVIQVSTEKGQFYVELTKDASFYNLS